MPALPAGVPVDAELFDEVMQDAAQWGEAVLINRDGTPRRYWDHQLLDLHCPSRNIIHLDGRDTGKSVVLSTDALHFATTTQGGLVDDANKRLADAYTGIFKAFVKHRSSVKVVTFWGVNDVVSWRAAGKPLLFDGENKPKPAFDAVIRAATGGFHARGMTLQGFVTFLVIGGLAGWITGLISKGRGFGLAGNLVVGIIGAFLGRFVFGLLGITANAFIGQLIFAVLGALLFCWLLRFIKR